jgi:glycine cleavage system H lipoate-binding protein
MRPVLDRTAAELPCVWVSAGVLSYRPCDREYECEGCPLYQALRGGDAHAVVAGNFEASCTGPAGVEDLVGRYLAELGTGCTLHLDRAYSAEGLWLASERSGELQIGLDDYTLRLLQPVDDVMLPRPGVWLAHMAPCAWVNRGRLAIALHCPVAGEVVEVCPRPLLTPPCNDDGTGPRWWFRLKPHEPVAAAAGLYRGEALLNWFLGRVRAVRDELGAVMMPEGSVAGPALADGGNQMQNLEIAISRERFEALVGRLFPQHV